MGKSLYPFHVMQKQILSLRWFMLVWNPSWLTCKTSSCWTVVLHVQGQRPSQHLWNPLFVLHFPSRGKLSQAPQSPLPVALLLSFVGKRGPLPRAGGVAAAGEGWAMGRALRDHSSAGGWTERTAWGSTCHSMCGIDRTGATVLEAKASLPPP